jgi:ubiquinone/menaquinone biosynthesis C-methylase UbiE
MVLPIVIVPGQSENGNEAAEEAKKIKPPTKGETRVRFAESAKQYRTSPEHVDSEDREILRSRLALDPSHLLLDIATGGGHTAAAFSPSVRKVVASDLTPEMIGEARITAAERGCRNMAFVVADVESLPFATGTFDRVTCRIAPHHFPDLPAAVGEMLRVTKPGGLVGIIDSVVPDDPALDAFLNGVERVRDPTHVRSYRIEEWNTVLEQAGLFLLHVSRTWKKHPFDQWVARAGAPPHVRREAESMFLTAFPRAREYFRVRIENGRVLSYSDEKGIFVGRKEEGR